MKLIIVIMTALMVQVSAAGFAQKITFVKKNASLEQIFNEIRKQTGYDVLWLGKDLDVAQKINADFRQAGLDEVMQKSLADLKLSYTIEDKNIVIKKIPPSFLDRLASVIVNDDGKFADIRGVVRNERGEPLEGITVMVKGAKTGTRTNAQGEFVLKGVKKGDVLVFTGVAIETFEYTAKDDKNIDLNLKARLVQLEEVGVTYSTGYQKIPKERATGSFVFIDSATINRRIDGNILDRLKNLVPGLLFDKNRSGGQGDRLQLRGMYSFSEAMAVPLIVVDNFPYEGNINDINPNDVENITILRDAAAASIWGAKAGNGVIVITTKQGKLNQKAQISLTSTFALNGKPDLFKLPILSSAENVDLERFLYENGVYDYSINNPITPVSKVAEILEQLKTQRISKEESDGQLDVLRSTDIRNDLLKYSYRNAIRQSHALNISGGSSFIKYFISAGYNKDLNNLIRNDNSRFTLSSNNTITLFKNLEVQTNLDFSSGRGAANNSFGYGSVYLNIPMYYNLADAEGNPLAVPRYFRGAFTDTVGNGKLLDWSYRPLDELTNNDITNRNQVFNGRINVNYALLKSLKINMDYQYSKSNVTSRTYNSIDSYFTRDLINLFSNFSPGIPESQKYPVPLSGILDLANTELSSYNLRAGFSFSQNWNNRHQVNLTGGMEMSEKKTNFNASRNYGYSDDLSTTTSVDYVNAYPTYYGTPFNIPDLTGTKIQNQNSRFTAIYANGSYTYDNRYTLSASIRKDAANILGLNTNERGRPFWHTGILWKINKEGFYSLDFLPTLSARVSLGNGGNTRFSSSALTTISYRSSFDNSGLNMPFAIIRALGNPNLKWEKVRTVNIALDFGLKNGVIDGSIEYYKKRSTDVLANRDIDPTTGVRAITANSASIDGNGIDININAKIIRTSALNWNISGSFSTAEFVVREYLFSREFLGAVSDGSLIPVKGYNPYLLTSFKWLGLDPSNGDPQGFFDGKLSKDWDRIVYETPWNDIVKHGTAVPESFGNIVNNITYKNFTFSTNIIYKFSYYFRRSPFNYIGLYEPSGILSFSNEYNQRWKSTGDDKITNVPSFYYPISYTRDQFYSSSEIRVEKGDHIRIDDFSLSYNLNKSTFKSLPFKSMNVTANVSNLNLILWKATTTDLDPEYPNGNIIGKSISLAVNLTF